MAWRSLQAKSFVVATKKDPINSVHNLVDLVGTEPTTSSMPWRQQCHFQKALYADSVFGTANCDSEQLGVLNGNAEFLVGLFRRVSRSVRFPRRCI